MGNDLVKRLKACANGAYREPETLQKYCGEAAARIEAIERALKPFRDLMERIECTSLHDYSDEAKWDLDGEVSVGDLRRAARAYANKGEPT